MNFYQQLDERLTPEEFRRLGRNDRGGDQAGEKDEDESSRPPADDMNKG